MAADPYPYGLPPLTGAKDFPVWFAAAEQEYAWLRGEAQTREKRFDYYPVAVSLRSILDDLRATAAEGSWQGVPVDPDNLPDNLILAVKSVDPLIRELKNYVFPGSAAARTSTDAVLSLVARVVEPTPLVEAGVSLVLAGLTFGAYLGLGAAMKR